MSNKHTQNSERDFLERKRLEFEEQSTKFVGQGGWVTGTDNDEGYAIHPHMYDDVWSFIQQAISEAREASFKEGKTQGAIDEANRRAKDRGSDFY